MGNPASPPSPPSPPSPASPPSPPSEPTPLTGEYYADPLAYWREQGVYMTGTSPSSPEHERQEDELSRILTYAWLFPRMESIFEAGCGWGRLARFFYEELPYAAYTGIDVGPAQLATAKHLRRKNAHYIESSIQAYEPATTEAYDLVVSCEVLMHIPPQDLEASVQKLFSLARPTLGRALIVEWVPDGELLKPTAPHNWPHPYEEIFKSLGAEIIDKVRTDRQMIYVLQPW